MWDGGYTLKELLDMLLNGQHCSNKFLFNVVESMNFIQAFLMYLFYWLWIQLMLCLATLTVLLITSDVDFCLSNEFPLLQFFFVYYSLFSLIYFIKMFMV